jgi:hypothetical protein
MKKLSFLFLIVLSLVISSKSYAQRLDLSNSDHINDSFVSSSNFNFSYDLDANGHTLHCHWVIVADQGTLVQPSLGVGNYYFYVGFSNDDHSFISSGGAQYFNYDVDLVSPSLYGMSIAAGFDNMSLDGSVMYQTFSGSDENIDYIP